MTNRSERNQMSAIETALMRREESIEAANERVLKVTRRMGMSFTTIQQVQAYVGKVRKVEKARADAINEYERWTNTR